MLTDLTPLDRRVDAFALFRLVINLGFAVGTGLGGLLITHFGFARLFVADAATSWVYAVIALALLPETRPRREVAESAGEPPMRGFGAVLADPIFRRYWLGTFVGAVAFCQTMVTLPLVLTDRGMSTAVYGALISTNGLIIITTEFWLSGWTRRFAAPRVMALGTLLLGGGFALNGLVGRSVPLLLAIVALWTFGEMLGSPTGQAYLSAIAPADLRGRYAGGLGFAWSLAFTIGPILGSVTLAAAPAALWWGALACGVVSALLFLTLPVVRLTGRTPPAEPAPVAPGIAIPRPRGRLVARFAKPRS
jgi:MFS family permease